MIPKQLDMFGLLAQTYVTNLADLTAAVIKKTNVGPIYEDDVNKPIHEIRFVDNSGDDAQERFQRIKTPNLENLTGFGVDLHDSRLMVSGMPFILGFHSAEGVENIYVADGSHRWTPDDRSSFVPRLREEVFAGLITARAEVMKYLQEHGKEFAGGYLIAPEIIPQGQILPSYGVIDNGRFNFKPKVPKTGPFAPIIR